jgi:tetratricopeptide (TPR) repeat protein
MADNTRIEELRRRVESDPASIAFAALAEEYRRAGQHADAIATCKAGLRRHPAYLSAHVTLGRALIEVGQYDEARQELEHVLKLAPENLAAIRGLAEIHHRLGDSDGTDLPPEGGSHMAQEGSPHGGSHVAQEGAQSGSPLVQERSAQGGSHPVQEGSAQGVSHFGAQDGSRSGQEGSHQARGGIPLSQAGGHATQAESHASAAPAPSPPAFEPAAAIPLARTAAIDANEPAPWEMPLVTPRAAAPPAIDPEPAPRQPVLEPAPAMDPALAGLEAFHAAILRARSELEAGGRPPRS